MTCFIDLLFLGANRSSQFIIIFHKKSQRYPWLDAKELYRVVINTHYQPKA